MSMTLITPEKADQVDATEILAHHINATTLMAALRRFKTFYEDIDTKSTSPRPNFPNQALRQVIARAGDHIKPGKTVNIMRVLDDVMTDQAFMRFGYDTLDVKLEVVRFLQDVGNDLTRIPRMQAYFLPTAVFGVWRRSSFVHTEA